MVKINKDSLKDMLEEIQTAYQNSTKEFSFHIINNTGFVDVDKLESADYLVGEEEEEEEPTDYGIYDVESVISELESNNSVFCNLTTAYKAYVGREVSLIKSIRNDNIMYIDFYYSKEGQKEEKLKELKEQLSEEEFSKLIISDEEKRTINEGDFSFFGFILSKNDEGEYIAEFGQFGVYLHGRQLSGQCVPEILVLKLETIDEFDSVVLNFLEKYKL